jgi:hypothetical protein
MGCGIYLAVVSPAWPVIWPVKCCVAVNARRVVWSKTKILKISVIVLLAIVLVAGTVIFSSDPKLPDDINETIDALLASELPELLQGDTG